MAQQLFQKSFKRDGIKLRIELCDQLAATKINRTKERNGLARWGMEQNGIGLLRRNPHDTSGSVLLEVAFIQTPQVKAFVPD